MGEAVELRAYLADLRNDELLVRSALVRLRIHRRTLRLDFESAPRGKRHPRRKDVPKLDQFARTDQSRRPQDSLRVHEIGRAALIVFPPLGRTSLVVGGRLPGLRAGRVAY